LWGSSRLAWGVSVDAGPVGGAVVRVRAGGEQVPALVPLALLSLAALAAVAGTGGWLRRALGVLVALAGVAALAVAVGTASSSGPAAIGLSQQQAGQLHGAERQIPFGHGLAGLGGALLVAGGVLLVWFGHRMPRMG